MTDFRQLSEQVWASPQITPAEVAEAASLGFRAIVNNRPEDESADQTTGDAIAEAARASGLAYHAIPITHAGFSEAQARAMAAILEQENGPILAYCRSGTRSTLLWSLAEASRGGNPQKIAANAASAGYDVSPVRAMIDMFAAGAD